MNSIYVKEELEKLSIEDLVDIYMDLVDSKDSTKKLVDLYTKNDLEYLSEDERKLVGNEIEVLLLAVEEKSKEGIIELFNKEEIIEMVMFYGNNRSITKRLPALHLRVQDLLTESLSNFEKRFNEILRY